ncbi:3-oxoacyl-[acyl-carrier-protein] reductase FabG [subsurface metagenome]
MELTNQVAFITGSTGGIGSEICKSLAKEGADVSICYHSKYEEAQSLFKEITSIGRKALVVKGDVSKKEDVISAIEMTRNTLGPIDILVNNAAMTLAGKLEEISEYDWDHCMAVNLKSVFLCTQVVIPEMKKRNRGSIINITSLAAKTGGIASAACYSASKAGVSILTIQTAKELLSYNINVNGVAPGVIDTTIWETYGKGVKERTFSNLIRGAGKAIDIANAVVFLASSKSRYITGEIIDVNGGLLMD